MNPATVAPEKRRYKTLRVSITEDAYKSIKNAAKFMGTKIETMASCFLMNDQSPSYRQLRYLVALKSPPKRKVRRRRAAQVKA